MYKTWAVYILFCVLIQVPISLLVRDVLGFHGVVDFAIRCTILFIIGFSYGDKVFSWLGNRLNPKP